MTTLPGLDQLARRLAAVRLPTCCRWAGQTVTTRRMER